MGWNGFISKIELFISTFHALLIRVHSTHIKLCTTPCMLYLLQVKWTIILLNIKSYKWHRFKSIFLPGLCTNTFTQPLIEVIKLGVVWRVTSRNALTFWYRSFTFNSNKSPTRCNKFSVYYPDVSLQLNIFRAFSRPSSGAQWLQW